MTTILSLFLDLKVTMVARYLYICSMFHVFPDISQLGPCGSIGTAPAFGSGDAGSNPVMVNFSPQH